MPYPHEHRSVISREIKLNERSLRAQHHLKDQPKKKVGRWWKGKGGQESASENEGAAKEVGGQGRV